ncbi:hypothetical protein M501DRAFT_995199 [Patellaria atrata CBS 101060]|uniref:Uncharacterized protein n=1 Tax=Patellaria atrata CBS 101060 TaxID=1346257 RepID=A0A9P4VQL8_9PEZI|nr:hypothetical protein M501DRAFT_995199 [Patellaria atrata CBS 101060]
MTSSHSDISSRLLDSVTALMLICFSPTCIALPYPLILLEDLPLAYRTSLPSYVAPFQTPFLPTCLNTSGQDQD